MVAFAKSNDPRRKVMRRMLAPGLAILALIAICFHGSFVGAQASEQESEKAAVDRAYRACGEAFSRGDLSSVVQHCNVPFVVILPQEIRVLSTAPDVEKFYSTARQDLKDRGYSHSELSEVHIKLLGPTVALVSSLFTRYKTDGSELATLGATYLLRKTDDVWKIMVITVHPAKDVIRAD
jgi:ketosteroid isomerase-like protein